MVWVPVADLYPHRVAVAIKAPMWGLSDIFSRDTLVLAVIPCWSGAFLATGCVRSAVSFTFVCVAGRS